jgi:hypothetical protein
MARRPSATTLRIKNFATMAPKNDGAKENFAAFAAQQIEHGNPWLRGSIILLRRCGQKRRTKCGNPPLL